MRSLLVGLLAVAVLPAVAVAQPRAVPFQFVGTDAQCGGPGTGGSRIVTGEWANGIGLPDDLAINNDDQTTAAKRDMHRGLLFSKNGLTTDCSAPGARITGVYNHTFSELGFDYRNGTHCGAGAPRFNVETDDGGFYFLGCASGEKSAAPQDPDQWTRVRFDGSTAFPSAIPFGAPIKSITIVYDEGTDTTGTEDPSGVGLSILDNIDINGQIISHP